MTKWWMAAMAATMLAACGDSADTSGSDTDTADSDTQPAELSLSDIQALEGDATAGEAVYTGNCAGCHKADGSGGAGPRLTGRHNSTSQVVSIVYHGEDSMPAYKDTLEGQEIADVAAYVVETFMQ